jgi:murein L,D-transpeptidase YcbB/YkuD
MMSPRAISRFRSWSRAACSSLLVFLALTGRANAQDVQELIRARIEEFAATGVLQAAGEPIAARNLMPRFYEARAFEPTWKSAAQVEALLELIDDSYLEGLDPKDYHADAVLAARKAFADVATLTATQRADYDLVLTDSVIRLGYHLWFGKVDPVSLDPHWNLSRDLGSDPVEAIQAAIDARSMREFAQERIPRYDPIYAGFKRALAQYRAIAADGGWPRVAGGPTLKAGMSDARVPVLVRRLAITQDLDLTAVDAASASYDGPVVAAVQRFQQRHGLVPDGVVGPRTLDALNVPVTQRVEQIRANLERARWVLYDPESEFIVVNIASFQAYVVRRGEVIWRSRVVVGRPYTRTPVFAAEMKYVVFNPSWAVPSSIARNELLPEVRHNARYLESNDIDAIDSEGRVADAASVNWANASAGTYRFVQRPGPNNALGRIKFMFPNEHDVYLHDTPSRDLFERTQRAFSHGCIRLDDVYGLAQLLLGWDRATIDATIAAGATKTVFLEKPLPVMILYWTTQTDADGRVLFFEDLYSRDAAVIAALAAPFEPGPHL